MSMDLEVWSREAFHVPQQLPDAAKWELDGNEWAFEDDGWHLLVTCAQDVPNDSVVAKLPERGSLVVTALRSRPPGTAIPDWSSPRPHRCPTSLHKPA